MPLVVAWGQKIPNNPEDVFAGEGVTGHEALVAENEGVFRFCLP